MKVEIVIREDLDIPHAIIYTSEITEEVQRVLNYMRENTGTLLGSLDERMYVLHPKEIFWSAWRRIEHSFIQRIKPIKAESDFMK